MADSTEQSSRPEYDGRQENRPMDNRESAVPRHRESARSSRGVSAGTIRDSDVDRRVRFDGRHLGESGAGDARVIHWSTILRMMRRSSHHPYAAPAPAPPRTMSMNTMRPVTSTANTAGMYAQIIPRHAPSARPESRLATIGIQSCVGDVTRPALPNDPSMVALVPAPVNCDMPLIGKG